MSSDDGTRGGAPLPPGVGVALVSLFDADGRLDVAATTAHAVWCAERGVTSVLIAGTTGEPWRLTATDRIVLGHSIRAALPGTPVFVGTGDFDAQRACELTAEVARAGVADALLVLSAPGTAAEEFYSRIIDAAGGVPVLAYHLPAVSAPGVPVEALRDLAVAGIKDSSGDAERLGAFLVEGRRVYVGSPCLLSLAGPCGAHGAILGLANTLPAACLDAWAGDAAAQRRLFSAHLDSLMEFPTRLKPRA